MAIIERPSANPVPALAGAGASPALVTPTIWSGLAEHHMPFGGTMTLDLPTFMAIVGGMAISTILTLFLIPVVYTLVVQFTDLFRRKPRA